jgi:hypothetical protein
MKSATDLIIHDRHTKFTAGFDAVLKKKEAVDVRRSAYRAPDTVSMSSGLRKASSKNASICSPNQSLFLTCIS